MYILTKDQALKLTKVVNRKAKEHLDELVKEREKLLDGEIETVTKNQNSYKDLVIEKEDHELNKKAITKYFELIDSLKEVIEKEKLELYFVSTYRSGITEKDTLKETLRIEQKSYENRIKRLIHNNAMINLKLACVKYESMEQDITAICGIAPIKPFKELVQTLLDILNYDDYLKSLK